MQNLALSRRAQRTGALLLCVNGVGAHYLEGQQHADRVKETKRCGQAWSANLNTQSMRTALRMDV